LCNSASAPPSLNRVAALITGQPFIPVEPEGQGKTNQVWFFIVISFCFLCASCQKQTTDAPAESFPRKTITLGADDVPTGENLPKQIFVANYKLYLPSEEIAAEIKSEQEKLRLLIAE